MLSLADLANRLQATEPEDKRIVTGISWNQYQALLSNLGESSAYRVAYLPLLCPSPKSLAFSES